MIADRIGYIRIGEFSMSARRNSSKTRWTRLIADGARALVLDVRHNGGGRQGNERNARSAAAGGYNHDATDQDGHETVYSSERGDDPTCRSAVLVDEQSISAAEFFAAALQNTGAARWSARTRPEKGGRNRRSAYPTARLSICQSSSIIRRKATAAGVGSR